MINLACWNIRGLNEPSKQWEVRKFISDSHLDLVGIIETKVRSVNSSFIMQQIFGQWSFCANYQCHTLGRIWVGWNPNTINVTKHAESDQVIHCHVHHIGSNSHFFVSFVYAMNDMVDRRSLWADLRHHSSLFNNVPWIILGDFNIIRNPSESVGCSGKWSTAMIEFEDCLQDSELEDLRFSGMQFTWRNKRDGTRAITRKLDRVLVNQIWNSSYQHAAAEFLPPGVSDHSPVVVKLGNNGGRRKTPFKFFSHLADKEDFLVTVAQAWTFGVHGSLQFKLSSKLKRLKNVFKSLCKDRGHSSELVLSAKAALLNCQRNIDMNPSDHDLIQEEKTLLAAYLEVAKDEELIFKQKSRILWLKEGDQNTSFFFRTMMNRRNRKKITSIQRMDGSVANSDEEVKSEAIDYFKLLLGQPSHSMSAPERLRSLDSIILRKVSDQHSRDLVREFSSDDIKRAFFSMSDHKAPGPDGFNPYFFKKAWPIIGQEVIDAVKEFFSNGMLLKELNSTIITLVPKVPNPTSMNDFRPISCCNTIYKAISKLIASRLKEVIPSLVDHSQAAFIPGRRIGDNILISQELFRNYHKNYGAARCAIKVDLRKAFDTINWGFLMDTLNVMGFPILIRNWIWQCISTPKFSVNVNGELAGFFPSMRGLRQGDPISPYLFVIAMEVLSLTIKQHVVSNDSFKYHWRCKDIKLTHLMFADDILLFCHGDLSSAKVLSDSLDHFQALSGLQVNHAKSSLFMSAISDVIRDQITHLFDFPLEQLPVKYLGIPLISTRLKTLHCNELIIKIERRINSWTNRFLSFASRLTLIQSVIHSMHTY